METLVPRARTPVSHWATATQTARLRGRQRWREESGAPSTDCCVCCKWDEQERKRGRGKRRGGGGWEGGASEGWRLRMDGEHKTVRAREEEWTCVFWKSAGRTQKVHKLTSAEERAWGGSGHPATLKSQTHSKEPLREKEKRKSTWKKRRTENSFPLVKEKKKEETPLRDCSIVQKRTGAPSHLVNFFVPANSNFTLAYCFP